MADRFKTALKPLLQTLPDDRPILIAGPTASGKSALALEIAQARGGVIVNADASQVYSCWRVLTARPSAEEEARAPHALYGHVPADAPYSTGHWLREVAPYLAGGARPIIVGGTGLYFSALTRGLADIPATPPEIRAEADSLSLDRLRKGVDDITLGRLDQANRARVQRAWEVQRATGRGLADWQSATGSPLLALADCTALVLHAEKEWLNERIARRFDLMIAQGALDEAVALRPQYDPAKPAHKAIGAPELMAHLDGLQTLEESREAAIISTRQFAKRQRTWFRSKMRDWHPLNLPT